MMSAKTERENQILSMILSKKSIALFIVILLFITAAIFNSGWKNNKLIVFRWVKDKGLTITVENSSLSEDVNQSTTYRIHTTCGILEKKTNQSTTRGYNTTNTTQLEYNTTNKGKHVWVIVYSQPDHVSFRGIIRKTWGNNNFLSSRSIKIYFLMGFDEDTILSHNLKVEFTRYKDLILQDFVNSTNNEILMTLTLFRRLSQCCVKTLDYVIKTDDNVYLNLPYIYDYLPSFHKGLLMGFMRSSENVDLMDMNSTSEFDFHENHTEYLDGSTYVMSMDVVEKLYLTSENTTSFRNLSESNKYITGISKLANISLTSHQMFTYMKNVDDPCVLGTIVVSHNLSDKDILDAHEKFVKKNQKECSGIIYLTSEDGVYFQNKTLPGPKNPYVPSVIIRNRI